MKTKTILCALALSLAPTLSFAACSGMAKHDQTAMSCAEGQVFDAATRTCVDQTTS